MQTFNSDLNIIGIIEATGLGETLIAEVKDLIAAYVDPQQLEETAEIKAKLTELDNHINALQSKYNDAVRQFNAAIETINAVSARLAALEANYDPTIIK